MAYRNVDNQYNKRKTAPLEQFFLDCAIGEINAKKYNKICDELGIIDVFTFLRLRENEMRTIINMSFGDVVKLRGIKNHQPRKDPTLNFPQAIPNHYPPQYFTEQYVSSQFVYPVCNTPPVHYYNMSANHSNFCYNNYNLPPQKVSPFIIRSNTIVTENDYSGQQIMIENNQISDDNYDYNANYDDYNNVDDDGNHDRDNDEKDDDENNNHDKDDNDLSKQENSKNILDQDTVLIAQESPEKQNFQDEKTQVTVAPQAESEEEVLLKVHNKPSFVDIVNKRFPIQSNNNSRNHIQQRTIVTPKFLPRKIQNNHLDKSNSNENGDTSTHGLEANSIEYEKNQTQTRDDFVVVSGKKSAKLSKKKLISLQNHTRFAPGWLGTNNNKQIIDTPPQPQQEQDQKKTNQIITTLTTKKQESNRAIRQNSNNIITSGGKKSATKSNQNTQKDIDSWLSWINGKSNGKPMQENPDNTSAANQKQNTRRITTCRRKKKKKPKSSIDEKKNNDCDNISKKVELTMPKAQAEQMMSQMILQHCKESELFLKKLNGELPFFMTEQTLIFFTTTSKETCQQLQECSIFFNFPVTEDIRAMSQFSYLLETYCFQQEKITDETFMSCIQHLVEHTALKPFQELIHDVFTKNQFVWTHIDPERGIVDSLFNFLINAKITLATTNHKLRESVKPKIEHFESKKSKTFEEMKKQIMDGSNDTNDNTISNYAIDIANIPTISDDKQTLVNGNTLHTPPVRVMLDFNKKMFAFY